MLGSSGKATGPALSGRGSPVAGVIAASLLAALAAMTAPRPEAAEPVPIQIVVFDFELEDRSAGDGVIAPDAIDVESLQKATEEARRMLAVSRRYLVLEPGAAAGEMASAGGIRHCRGCEAPLAAQLGADQAMVGLITRLNRTEYTLQVLVRDARSGAVLSNDFTGLRMGANYSWPRGVTWLMDRTVLSAQRAQ